MSKWSISYHFYPQLTDGFDVAVIETEKGVSSETKPDERNQKSDETKSKIRSRSSARMLDANGYATCVRQNARFATKDQCIGRSFHANSRSFNDGLRMPENAGALGNDVQTYSSLFSLDESRGSDLKNIKGGGERISESVDGVSKDGKGDIAKDQISSDDDLYENEPLEDWKWEIFEDWNSFLKKESCA